LSYHAYRWLTFRLTYRRANQDRIQVRGYKEESIITTPYDITVLNDLDRFHLMTDVIDCVPRISDQGDCLERQRRAMPSEHRRYIDRHGRDLPAIREWTWNP
jgi:xylulose-5-phosphate/fructose-6-phosphate phosphoketolase